MPAGYKVPTMGQVEYPTLKTHMLEHPWLQNSKIPCNTNFAGCEPYFFNHGFASVPVTLFYDGSVRLMGVLEAMSSDRRVKRQSDNDAGLWSRDTSVLYNIEVVIGGGFVVLGPLLVTMGRRNDLRAELQHLELVRTWPVPGSRLLLAEVLGPASAGTYAAFCGGLAVAAGYYGAQLLDVVKRSDVASNVIVPDGQTLFGAPFGLALLFKYAGSWA